MKWLIILSWLLCAATVHYYDNIIVISGFYEGCTGQVESKWSYSEGYTVNLTSCPNGPINARVTLFDKEFKVLPKGAPNGNPKTN